MNTSQNKKHFKNGDVIIQQGDEDDHAFIIEKGSVEILLEKDQGLIQSLGTRGVGAIIGEMSMVDSKPRTATIKALEDCELLEITRQDFDRRLENADPVVRMIMQVILTRYRDMITRAHILNRTDDIPTLEDLERGMVEKTNAVENIKLTNDLKEALHNNNLQLFYQPIIDLSTDKISGFEALMRWEHPEKGFIPPDIFIPIAEESGLITELSRWAVKEACGALKRVQKQTTSGQPFFVSVNFSSADFVAPDFKNYVENSLKKENLGLDQIHIEITERLLIDHPDNARKILEECRRAGMIISIDDFGTGYSSLSYLHYFPIDILKIDRSFINNMSKDEGALELVKSIISLGHNMKMKIIAEGIEKTHQAEMLKHLGCDKAQGYLFARPMAESDLIAHIQKNA